MQAYRDQVTAFLAAIRGEESSSPLPRVGTGDDGRAAVQACRAMLTASAERRWIELPR